MSPNSTPSSSSNTLCSYRLEPYLPSSSPSPNLTDDHTKETPTKTSNRTSTWGSVALAFLGLCILSLAIGAIVSGNALVDESRGVYTLDGSGNWVQSGQNRPKEIGGYICCVLGVILALFGFLGFVSGIGWFIKGRVDRWQESNSTDSLPV